MTLPDNYERQTLGTPRLLKETSQRTKNSNGPVLAQAGFGRSGGGGRE